MNIQPQTKTPPTASKRHLAAQATRADLLRLINGFQASQAIHVAATLRLADHLSSGAKTAADLAAVTRTHSVALHRLLRALASIGIFEECDDGRFALTETSEFLRSDIAGTHAPMVELVGRDYFWRAWGNLLHTVRTGTTAFDHVHGSSVWEYRAQHPEEVVIFDRAMASGTERYAEAVVEVCDFGRFDHIVDVGGGDGVFLTKILAAHPRLRGTLFDQPHIVARAASLEKLGLLDCYVTVGGDFFAEVPSGGDAYLLKWILHDWDDTACVSILRSCRKAMKPNGSLFIVEHIIGPPNAGPEGKFMDLTMMALTGGRERTRDEFATLLAAAGFQLLSVTPTATSLSLIEAAIEDA
jgi:hypothetical protein